MARRIGFLTALGAAPLLASCMFILDYDELQGGEPLGPSGGAPGEAGATSGGAAGAPVAECGECDDLDPCTIDTCDETGDTPRCLHEGVEGLQPDGFDATLSADLFLRVSIAAGAQSFYVSALEANAGASEVNVYRLAAEGTELEPLQRVSELELGAGILSNAGLAVEPLPLGAEALHGFVGVVPKLGDQPRVFHFMSQDGETTSSLAGASYKPTATTFPQALSVGGKIVAAWLQADGTIAVHDAAGERAQTYGSTSLPATSVALLSTEGDEPAVMFTAQAEAEAPLGTYVETAGQNRARVAECETRPGSYVSAGVISTQLPGVWLASITRAGDEYLTTGSATLACGANACTAIPEECEEGPPGNSVRNVAGATVDLPSDEAGIVYSVLAVPRLELSNTDPPVVEGRLSVVLGRAQFSGAGSVESTTIGGDPARAGLMEIARSETDEERGFAGPDWPAVGLLPTRQAVVAWIQPDANSEGANLHIRRYRMCLPAE
jgi:hypothetical protein